VLAGVGYDDETIEKLLAMGVIAEPMRSEPAG
jgi:hypothetical protein